MAKVTSAPAANKTENKVENTNPAPEVQNATNGTSATETPATGAPKPEEKKEMTAEEKAQAETKRQELIKLAEENVLQLVKDRIVWNDVYSKKQAPILKELRKIENSLGLGKPRAKKAADPVKDASEAIDAMTPEQKKAWLQEQLAKLNS